MMTVMMVSLLQPPHYPRGNQRMHILLSLVVIVIAVVIVVVGGGNSSSSRQPGRKIERN